MEGSLSWKETCKHRFILKFMSKFLNRESEGWQCARDDLFNRMVVNLQVSKQKVQHEKFSRSTHDDQNPSTAKLKEYEDIATRDNLTGVYNVRYLVHKLVKEVQRSKRYKRPFSLMLISIDELEHLKKTYGDLTTQQIVKFGAKIISSLVREVDIVGRFAEDQFAIILPETDSSRALIVATRICEKIARLPVSSEFDASTLITSIGLASFPTHARDENNLLTTALQYLELAKHQGPNQIVSG